MKTTEELVDIWIKNNRAEWTDDAFDVIHDVLFERLGNVPNQDKPEYQRADLWAQGIYNFLKSTDFLTCWLGMSFYVVTLLGMFILQLFFEEDVPFIYLNVLLIITVPLLITSGVFIIKRKEVARPGATNIKGCMAVIEGVFIVTVSVLGEIALLFYFFKNLNGY